MTLIDVKGVLMTSMKTVTCHCGTNFQARTADVKRGWGKFCSKSCAKTKTQIARKANHSRPPVCTQCGDDVLSHGDICFHCEFMNEPQMGWDDHKH